jgi:RecA-family ATPase
MNTLPDRTLRYLSSPTPDGQRNAELFAAAQQYRDAGIDSGTAERELVPAAVRDGLPPSEAKAAIRSAYGKAPRKPIATSDPKTGQLPARPRPKPLTTQTMQARCCLAVNLENPPELPEPLPDGFATLLRTCFAEGENVGITFCALDADGKSRPQDRGTTYPRDWLLAKLAEAGGDVGKLWSSSDNAGLLVRINPMRDGGATDADVTSYRHALVECDGMELEKQLALFQQSELPIAALVYSGARSLHALVRIDAADAAEYAARVGYLFGALEKHGVDPVTRNPSRHTRVPGAARGAGRQELLAVNIGRKSFDDWHDWIEIKSNVPARIRIKDLAEFKATADPACLLSDRFLCKGGTCFIVGQSGLGKSSFCMQAAITWARGLPLLGVEGFLTPKRRLKSLIIQSENDLGDLAEAYQGVVRGQGLNIFDEAVQKDMEEMVVFRRDTIHTGEEFARVAAYAIEEDKPDLVWVDPTLAFFGDDMKDQKAVSRFFRQLLTPIAESTGVVWMMLHHTGKPSRNPKEAWSEDDFAYLGTGSSEQTNWARATMAILGEKDAPGIYKLLLGKRWKRAGLKGDDALPSRVLYMKHGDTGICWQRADYKPPIAKGKQKAAQKHADRLYDEFVSLGKPMTPAEFRKHCEKALGIPKPSFYRYWSEVLPRLNRDQVTGKFLVKSQPQRSPTND